MEMDGKRLGQHMKQEEEVERECCLCLQIYIHGWQNRRILQKILLERLEMDYLQKVNVFQPIIRIYYNTQNCCSQLR